MLPKQPKRPKRSQTVEKSQTPEAGAGAQTVQVAGRSSIISGTSQTSPDVLLVGPEDMSEEELVGDDLMEIPEIEPAMEPEAELELEDFLEFDAFEETDSFEDDIPILSFKHPTIPKVTTGGQTEIPETDSPADLVSQPWVTRPLPSLHTTGRPSSLKPARNAPSGIDVLQHFECDIIVFQHMQSCVMFSMNWKT